MPSPLVASFTDNTKACTHAFHVAFATVKLSLIKNWSLTFERLFIVCPELVSNTFILTVIVLLFEPEYVNVFLSLVKLVQGEPHNSIISKSQLFGIAE